MQGFNYRQAAFQDWLAVARKSLKGADPASLRRPTAEGIALGGLYTAADLEAWGYQETFPGMFPYTGGPQPTMHAGQAWTVRQYAGFSTAAESNAFYKRNLAAGQMGLSVAFDLATHRGYDSDDTEALGDVGMAGVAIDSVEDMKVLFAGIDLGSVTVSMTMNGAVLPILAAFIVVAEEQGVKPEQLSGTIQNDILKEYLTRNTYIYPPAPSMRIVGDIVAFCAKHMPKYNPISISGYHMQEAGANAVQELGFTVADGLEYVRTAIKRGLNVDDFAPRLSFFFGIGKNFYMEVAKLRAARLLWATRIRDMFNPQKENSLRLRTHCQTSGWSLTEQDPYNNIIRTTIEAMAAIMGGTQSLHTNAHDEALGLPTEASARIARNIQLVLRDETGIPSVIDPFAGSYMMESLTHSVFVEAGKIVDAVETSGGMVSAIESGWPQQRILEAAVRRQAAIDSGREPIIGVNIHRVANQAPVEVRKIEYAAVREAQIEGLRRLRQSRDAAAVRAALETLTKAAEDPEANLLEYAVKAMRVRATVGEVSEALEKVFGRHHAVKPMVRGAYGSAMVGVPEVLAVQKRIEQFAEDHGRQPRIYVAKTGQDGHDRGAQVVATGFSDLGFDVDMGPMFTTPEQVVRAAIDADVHVIGISSLANAHLTLVPKVMTALLAEGRGDIKVVLGGVIPPDDYEALRAMGVVAIFGPGTPIHVAAAQVLDVLTPVPA